MLSSYRCIALQPQPPEECSCDGHYHDPEELPLISLHDLSLIETSTHDLGGKPKHISKGESNSPGSQLCWKENDWSGSPTKQKEHLFADSHDSMSAGCPESREGQRIGKKETERCSQH